MRLSIARPSALSKRMRIAAVAFFIPIPCLITPQAQAGSLDVEIEDYFQMPCTLPDSIPLGKKTPDRRPNFLREEPGGQPVVRERPLWLSLQLR